MNMVIVQTFGKNTKKLLATVPIDFRVMAGDLAKIKTDYADDRNHLLLATCLCDSFTVKDGSPELSAVCAGFGTTHPVAEVKGCYVVYCDFGEDGANGAENSRGKEDGAPPTP